MPVIPVTADFENFSTTAWVNARLEGSGKVNLRQIRAFYVAWSNRQTLSAESGRATPQRPTRCQDIRRLQPSLSYPSRRLERPG
jgi:hypothetical protein